MRLIRRDPFLAALLTGLLVPGILLGTAIWMQDAFHLVPCHMCLEQRTALKAAMAIAALGLVLRRTVAGRILAVSAGGAVAASAIVAVQQLGGERHWWVLNTPCMSSIQKGASALDSIMNTPFVRCDVPQWSYAGLTMADLNAAACVMTTLTIAALVVIGENRRNEESSEPQLPDSEEN